MELEVSIDHVLLDGIDMTPAQRREFGAALESELSRLITLHGIAPELAQGTVIPRCGAPVVDLSAPLSAAHVGSQIAGAAFASFGAISEKDVGTP